jgi:hypothetical protein
MRGSTIHAWRLELELELGTGRRGPQIGTVAMQLLFTVATGLSWSITIALLLRSTIAMGNDDVSIVRRYCEI